MTFCHCCFIMAIPDTISHTERPVLLCGPCALHSDKPQQLARDHLGMTNSLRKHHAEAIAGKNGEVAEARREVKALEERIGELTATIVSDYNERPIGDVKKVVEDAVVKDAQSRARSALHQRDRAMGAVFRMDELHHAEHEKCSCGKRLRDCAEFKALAFIRDDYYRWERRQIELEKDHRHHGLPEDHPRGRGYRGRWMDWKGLPSTVVQDRPGLIA